MASNIPLAERLRPKNLDEYIGQTHLVGENGILRKILESGNLPSIIFWGPPGVGKTTLAKLVAAYLNRQMYTLSAVHSGVKDVRSAIEQAKKQQFFSKPNPILFIDEIHRFSKSQQDSLLSAVEQGIVTLIGATTENPSFEVISPLLSRCQVYILNSLDEESLKLLTNRALATDYELKTKKINIEETDALFRFSGGDARKLLNILELIVNSDTESENIKINNKLITEKLQENIATYDKSGEIHYDVISAFIKSVRGSDPNAAVYWLARMIEAGEDVKFIARRLIILASEDIGLANPNALLLANNCFQAVNIIGFPESRIILSQTTIYLANSPKSNSAYMAIKDAQNLVKETGDLPVPLHLRNAPTKLMKNIGYGADYKYTHSFDDNFIEQDYLPEKIKNKSIYKAGNNQQETKSKEFLIKKWKKKYDF
ncbi:MAG: replication-associated recombination protein A [Bacteroidales bacterium]|nr:replication-associated recombination protein A [Bacteroidales bacterium]MBN2758593.1 replication-associated recombination protein A [Bacteroidales bacterium]